MRNDKKVQNPNSY